MGPWSWLGQLESLGASRNGIAKLLIERHDESPWIKFDPWIPVSDEETPKPDFHVAHCAHADYDLRPPLESAKARITQNSQLNPNSLRRAVASLCGLAGIAPNNSGKDSLRDAVQFQDPSMALITYGHARPSDALIHIQKAFRGLCTALTIMQEADACCDRLTIIFEGRYEPLVSMKPVYVRDIIHFSEYLQPAAVDDPDSLKTCYRVALSLLQIFNPIESTQWPIDYAMITDLHCLHAFALLTQSLCLSVVLYCQAHIAPFEPFFLEREFRELRLLGMATTEDEGTCLKVYPRRLTCLDRMLNAPVMVFSSSSLQYNTADAVDMLASTDNIIDTWGPGSVTRDLSGDYENCIVSINLQGGQILRMSEDRYHWAKHDEIGHYGHNSGWHRRETIRIGALMGVNVECRSTEESYLMNLQGCLHPLGTKAPSWQQKEREIGLQGGQYGVVTFSAVWTKLPGASLKTILLDRLRDGIDSLYFLEAPYGLQVSICSGLAKRVRMRDLLAEVMPIWAQRTQTTRWQEMEEAYGLIEKLSSGDDLADTIQYMKMTEPDYYDTFWALIKQIADSLKDTGLRSSSRVITFDVGFIPRCASRPMYQINFEAEGANFWTKALKDTTSCATFAYFTTSCLQLGRHGCRNSTPEWHGQIRMLQTAIGRQTSTIMYTPEFLSLQDGDSFQFGAETPIYAKVIRRPSSADPQLLLQRLNLPRDIYKRLLERKARLPRLQEGLSLHEQVERVFLTSKDNTGYFAFV